MAKQYKKNVVLSPKELEDRVNRVKSEVDEPRSESMDLSMSPSVMCIGAGGFGTNAVQKYINLINQYDVKPVIIETSVSDYTVKDIPISIVGGSGSGQVTSANALLLRDHISDRFFIEYPPADINIIFFSLNGGSGSTATNFLLQELKRRNATTIGIGVVSLSSHKYCTNAMKALVNLESVCNQNNIYFPTMLFDNSVKQSVVDVSIAKRLKLLFQFLRKDHYKLDKSDKINWLRPDEVNGCSAGLTGMTVLKAGEKLANITTKTGELIHFDESFDGLIPDSLAVLSESQDIDPIMSSVLYHGVLKDNTIPPMSGVVGFPISETLQNTINDLNNRFNNLSNRRARLKLEVGETEEHETGLLF